MRLIHPERVQHDYRSSSEWDAESQQHGFQIGREWDWLWSRSVQNSRLICIIRQSILLPRDNHRDRTVMDITPEGLPIEIKREDYREPYQTKPLTTMLAERCTGGSKLSLNGIWNWMPKHFTRGLQRTPEKHTDILLTLPIELANRCQPRTQRRYHPNNFHREAVHRDSTECRIQRWRDLQMRCTKQLSERRCALLSWWLWPPTVMLTCYIWINDMPSTPDSIGVNCATPEWSPRVLYVNQSYDARSGSSQHFPKSRRDPCDDQLFHQRWPGQIRRGSMATIIFTKPKLNWIMCRSTTEWKFQFEDKSYTATKPQWQSTINMMEK